MSRRRRADMGTALIAAAVDGDAQWANDWLWALDGWIVASGVLCAVAASLLGNFLVLRRISLIGDAISHAVLPGLAAAFLITGSRHSLPMFIGAAVVGVLTAALTQWVRQHGRVDEGASMGVVFTTLFALGLVLIVRAADRVDLDPSCVLFGAIELTPLDTVMIGSWHLPRTVLTLSAVLLINLLFVACFYKELQLTSFDPAFSDSMGTRSAWLHYGLMTLVAVTAVASFESVGSILVVAMFVVPPATARLLTQRLSTMIVLAALIATVAVLAGHWSAITVPGWFGYRSTSTAGMMAVATGALLMLAIVFSPQQGLLTRRLRQIRLSLSILREDCLALLFRLEERGAESTLTLDQFSNRLAAAPLLLRLLLGLERSRGRIQKDALGHYSLTAAGRSEASGLVRAHRLWEQYLVDQVGVSEQRIHEHAEKLEHWGGKPIRDQLEAETQFPESDPHGSPIPKEH